MAQEFKDAALVRTGYGCNSACRFCDQGDWRSTRGDRTDAEVRASIQEAAVASTALVFAGGEVTLRSELPAWVAHARELGASPIVLQTNGRMLAYPKLVKSLVAAGVGVFAVALHGHTAPLHDWLTRTPGSYDQALKGMENVRRAGATLLVNTVITRSNFRHLPAMVNMLPRLGVSGIRFLWPRAEGEAVAELPALVPDPDMVAPYLAAAAQIGEAIGRRVSFDGSIKLLSESLHAQSDRPAR